MYWHNHMGDGAWIFMAVFWIALLVVLAWALTRIFSSGGVQTRSEPHESPEDILARRLASGEIDLETYDRLRKKLLERS